MHTILEGLAIGLSSVAESSSFFISFFFMPKENSEKSKKSKLIIGILSHLFCGVNALSCSYFISPIFKSIKKFDI